MTNQVDQIVKTILAHLQESKQLDLIAGVVDGLKASSEYKNAQNRVIATSAEMLVKSEIKNIET